MLVHPAGQELDSLAPESAGVHSDGLKGLEEGEVERSPNCFSIVLLDEIATESMTLFGLFQLNYPFVAARLTKGYPLLVSFPTSPDRRINRS